jgi:hypothetical protein
MRSPLITSAGFRETCVAFTVVLIVTAIGCSPADAVPVPVRFPEGITHGHLAVHSATGETVGHGEIVQIVKGGDLVESRLIFRFKDGSLHDEYVVFSQQRVFTLMSYHLIQQGPSFPEQLDASIDRETAEYKVRIVGTEGKELVRTGRFDLPQDVYNGMLIMVLKNLEPGADTTVNILSFTPEPEVFKLRLIIAGKHSIQIGGNVSHVTRYAFKPQMGMIKKVIGTAIGKLPANFHYDCWILDHDVPGFVQFEGPLQLMGPIMRIDLVSPRLSVMPEDRESAVR